MIKNITDYNFQYNLEDPIKIFKPLHNCQVIFESGDTYLNYVIKRQKTIKFHLQFLYNCIGF